MGQRKPKPYAALPLSGRIKSGKSRESAAGHTVGEEVIIRPCALCRASSIASAVVRLPPHSHFLMGAVMWLFQDLTVRLPNGAARGNQSIPGGSQELQCQAGVPRRRGLQELLVSQHQGTEPWPGREGQSSPQDLSLPGSSPTPPNLHPPHLSASSFSALVAHKYKGSPN